MTNYFFPNPFNCYKNYANILSNSQGPSQANTNELVKITSTDTLDFTVLPNGELLVNNGGAWQFISLYQMLNINSTPDAKDAILSGWYVLNGVNVPNSGAAGYVARVNATNVLTTCINLELKQGDVVGFGIRSVSSTGSLNVVISDIPDPANVGIPALIVTAAKL